MPRQVVIDSANGELRVGDMAFSIADAEPAGAIRLLPPGGPVLRPISFGERFRLVERALAAVDPVESLCAAIVRCATVLPAGSALSPTDESLCQTLALALAGAETDGPLFADAMLIVGAGSGWSYLEIERAEAARIDRLARRLQPQQPDADDGWNRMLFQADPVLDLASIRRSLAGRLLERLGDESAIGQEMDGNLPVFGAGDHTDRIDRRIERGAPMAGADRTPASTGIAGGEATEVQMSPMADGHVAGLSRLDELRGTPRSEPYGGSEVDEDEGRRGARVLGYRLARWNEQRPDVAPRSSTAPPYQRPAPLASGRSEEDKRNDGERSGEGRWGRDAGRLSGSSTARAASSDGRDAGSIPGPGALPEERYARPYGDPMMSLGSGPARAQGRADAMRAMPGGAPFSSVVRHGATIAPEDAFALPAAPELERVVSTMLPPPESSGQIQRKDLAATIMELADALAELLHEEADLRGIDR